MYHGNENVDAIVFDIGSSYTKIGFAGEDRPRYIEPTYVGIHTNNEKTTNIENNITEKHYYIGKDKIANTWDPSITIQSCINNETGIIENWDMIESIINHSYKNTLHVEMTDHPFLLTEPTLNTRNNREKFTELLFEKYDIPALFISKTSVLSCYANARVNGLVIEMGGGGTTITPVYDGFALQIQTEKSLLGGNILDTFLYDKLNDPLSLNATKPIRGHCEYKKIKLPNDLTQIIDRNLNLDKIYLNYMKLDIIRDLKESICRVADNTFDETANAQIPKIVYELPDGTMIQMGTERFSIPELYFQRNIQFNNNNNNNINSILPTNRTISKVSMIDMILKSISNTDTEFRKELYQNIILTGGSSCFENMGPRIEKELSLVIPPIMKTRLIVAQPSERKIGAWLGGSILGSLGSFHETWISKTEYAEHGSSLVQQKCP